MADEVTASKSASVAPPRKVTAKAEVDHDAKISAALDAARDAMVAGGMSVADADAFLQAARPSGVSTLVGNFADLNRSSGLEEVPVEKADEGRFHLAHKLEVKEEES